MSILPASAPRPKQHDSLRHRIGRRLGPWPWIGPAVVLIAAVVLWPVIEMVRTSLSNISLSGKNRGFVGLDNFRRLFRNPNLVPVLWRTAWWVVGVVVVTVLISMALAQLLNATFPGRRYVRWALIVPWAVSVVMTATVWRWMLNGFYGIVSRVLLDVHIISKPVEWLGADEPAFVWLMACAVFVSVPFTTYVLLAGLQMIPQDIYEAGLVDGTSPWQAYRRLTLPLLRPAITVATIVNLINVFNSFPIIWVMTQGGPGNTTDTTTTFMYKLAFKNQQIGPSGAMAVLNFVIILIVVAIYLRVVRPKADR